MRVLVGIDFFNISLSLFGPCGFPSLRQSWWGPDSTLTASSSAPAVSLSPYWLTEKRVLLYSSSAVIESRFIFSLMVEHFHGSDYFSLCRQAQFIIVCYLIVFLQWVCAYPLPCFLTGFIPLSWREVCEGLSLSVILWCCFAGSYLYFLHESGLPVRIKWKYMLLQVWGQGMKSFIQQGCIQDI